jgi:hypothetical protein
MTPSRLPPQLKANPPMYILGAVILVAVLGWMLFQAVDGLALPTAVAPARVVGRGYQAAGKTYITQIINNRPLVTSQTRPEAWLVELDVVDSRAQAAVPQEMFDRLNIGDQVIVSFSRRRLTGTVMIVDVRAPAGVAQ